MGDANQPSKVAWCGKSVRHSVGIGAGDRLPSPIGRGETTSPPRRGKCVASLVASAQGGEAQRRNGHLAICILVICVPIELNVVTISDAEVSKKKSLELLAQFCRSVEVGSPLVFT